MDQTRQSIANLVSRLRGQSTPDEKTIEEKLAPLKWHQWRGFGKSPGRRQARITRRVQAATTDRFYGRQARQLREVSRDRERRAVAVLAEVENRSGVAAGGLRAQLISEGKLKATGPKVVGWWTGSEEVDGKQVPVRKPLVDQRPIGHTPVEILAAFGIDDDATLELYEALVEDRENEAEARRAEKRQAGQAKREAAVTA